MGKSVVEWLAEGQKLIADEDAKKRAWAAEQAERSRDHWQKLVDFVREEMGEEFAEDLNQPSMWTCMKDCHMHLFRPFGAGAIAVQFRLTAEGKWALYNQGDAARSFTVHVDYRPNKVSMVTWEPASHAKIQVDSLARAVAICAAQTEAFKAIQAQCDAYHEQERDRARRAQQETAA